MNASRLATVSRKFSQFVTAASRGTLPTARLQTLKRPDFPAELRHSHIEQPCYENSDGIGVNEDLALGEEADEMALPGEAGGGTGGDGAEPLSRAVTFEDG